MEILQKFSDGAYDDIMKQDPAKKKQRSITCPALWSSVFCFFLVFLEKLLILEYMCKQGSMAAEVPNSQTLE